VAFLQRRILSKEFGTGAVHGLTGYGLGERGKTALLSLLRPAEQEKAKIVAISYVSSKVMALARVPR
jgi:hypothetical protein